VLRKNKGSQAGFSLVELMVVISIIGLLAGIVGYNVVKYQKKAANTKAEADLQKINGAIKMYYMEEKKYPDSLEELVNGTTEGGEPYLDGGSKALKDPWKREYVYNFTGSGRPPYSLMSYGEDGVPSQDDINPFADTGR
jgi:general secretion pathway protein G